MKKLIYIVGGGHSGSTLLDMIISSAPGVFSAGEILYYDFYKYKMRSGKRASLQVRMGKCTCGSAFDRCPFWRRLANGFHVKNSWTRAESLEIFFSLLTIGPGNRNSDEREFLEELSKRTGKKVRYILDSSKDPRRLYELAQDPVIRKKIFVIHLTRDARSYVRSYQNPIRKQRHLRAKSSIHACAEWVLINIVSRLVIWRLGLPYMWMSYDMFCRRPWQHLNKINKALGIGISNDYLQSVRETEYHNINGNYMKFSKITTIKYDRSWKHAFGPVKKMLLSIFMYPWNRYFVYRK